MTSGDVSADRSVLRERGTMSIPASGWLSSRRADAKRTRAFFQMTLHGDPRGLGVALLDRFEDFAVLSMIAHRQACSEL